MSIETVNSHIPQWDMADRMRKTLRESGASVQEIADEFGVSRNTIGSWINGHIPPSQPSQRLWAIRFGVPLEWLQHGATATSSGGPGNGLPLPQLPHLDSNQKPFDSRVNAAA